MKTPIKDIKLHLRLPVIVCDMMDRYAKLGYSRTDIVTMALIYYFRHNKTDIV
jgi:hypothetical protein